MSDDWVNDSEWCNDAWSELLGLRVQLATALKELDEARAEADAAGKVAEERRYRAKDAEAERDRFRAVLTDVLAEAERLIRGAGEELEQHVSPRDPDRAFHEGVECAAANLRARAKAGLS